MGDRRSECPSNYIPILVCSEPKCSDLIGRSVSRSVDSRSLRSFSCSIGPRSHSEAVVLAVAVVTAAAVVVAAMVAAVAVAAESRKKEGALDAN